MEPVFPWIQYKGQSLLRTRLIPEKSRWQNGRRALVDVERPRVRVGPGSNKNLPPSTPFISCNIAQYFFPKTTNILLFIVQYRVRAKLYTVDRARGGVRHRWGITVIHVSPGCAAPRASQSFSNPRVQLSSFTDGYLLHVARRIPYDTPMKSVMCGAIHSVASGARNRRSSRPEKSDFRFFVITPLHSSGVLPALRRVRKLARW